MFEAVAEARLAVHTSEITAAILAQIRENADWVSRHISQEDSVINSIIP